MKDARLHDLAAGRLTLGPETIHVDVTNSCNTDCVTCWDHSPLLATTRSAAWKRQRVEAAAVAALLDDAAALGGLRAVIVSGQGDPLVHPEIDRILADVKRRGLHLTIITNLIPADVARIIELGVDQLLIGIHAASEPVYQAFHPSFRSDEWRRLHGMLARLRDAGRRDKHVHVLCELNAGELPAMVRQGHDYGAAQVTFKLASLGEGREAVGIGAATRQRLLDALVPEGRREASRLGVATNLDVLALQLGAGGLATAPIEEVGCFMGHHYARVLVDGTVLYCCNTEVVVGSLRSGTSFGELWHGEAWSALRQRMREGRYLESCRQCGKLNQNVKLGRRFAALYGEAARREVIGLGGTA